MGQASEGDGVDAGFGDLADALVGDAAGGLGERDALAEADAFRHQRAGHVVEQYPLGAAE